MRGLVSEVNFLLDSPAFNTFMVNAGLIIEMKGVYLPIFLKTSIC